MKKPRAVPAPCFAAGARCLTVGGEVVLLTEQRFADGTLCVLGDDGLWRYGAGEAAGRPIEHPGEAHHPRALQSVLAASRRKVA